MGSTKAEHGFGYAEPAKEAKLKQVRLKSNVIVPDGPTKSRLITLGTIVDVNELPQKFRSAEFVEDVDAWRKNKVMLLRDLTYNQKLHDPADPGMSISCPVEIKAGQLVKLAEIPRSAREVLRDQVDYTSEFTREQQQRLLDKAEVIVDTNQEMSIDELEAYGRARY